MKSRLGIAVIVVALIWAAVIIAVSMALGDVPQASRVLTILGGGAAASITSISLTGTDANQFAISGGTCGSTFPLALAAGNTCTMQVTFTPTSLGGKTATLAVASNAPAVSIPLAGVGVTVGRTCTVTSPRRLRKGCAASELPMLPRVWPLRAVW